MISFGVLLMVFAAGSWFLPRYAGFQFWLMSWVDNWGLTVGIVIRCVIGAIGLALLVKGLSERRSRG